MGHVCVDGRVLERSVCMDTKCGASVLLSLSWCRKEMCICPREGWVRMGGLAPWLAVLGGAQPPWLQLGKLLLYGGQCKKGQRLSWLICRWPQARGLKLQCARRGLWAQPLPSFPGMLVLISELCHHCQCCCGAAAAPGSAGAALSMLLISAGLWGACNRQPVLSLKNKLGGAWLSVHSGVELREEQSLGRLRVTPLLREVQGAPVLCPSAAWCCWSEFSHPATALPRGGVPPFISSDLLKPAGPD